VIGLLAGSSAGAVEHLLLRDAFSGDRGRAHWKALVPDAVLGGGAACAITSAPRAGTG
jgi:hypothetical protein